MDDEAFFKAVEEFLKYDKQTEYQKDFSVLYNFTDEELAQELLRRTSLGKELE